MSYPKHNQSTVEHWEKSLLSYQITNTKSGLNQEESHLGIAVSWENAKSKLHQHLYP